MKNKISYIFLTTLLVLSLSGCGSDETGPLSDLNTEATQDSLDPAAVQKLDRQENSLDAYSSIVNMPLQVENPSNAVSGGGESVFLGASRAYRFKKHLFENADECWDELAFATADGEAGSKSFDRENQLWYVEPVAGTDHYVTFDYEVQEGSEDSRYFLTERDENHKALREFPLDFLNGDSFSEIIMGLLDFAVDSSGTVHLVQSVDDGWQYRLVSPEGEILAEYVSGGEDFNGLALLYDGRIAFSTIKADAEGMALQYMDEESGKPMPLASLEKNIYRLTLLDEDTLLYADQEGVYRSKLSGKDPELLYCWANHGITALEVPAMGADENGRIALIYEDSEDYNYLCLEPATGETELLEITLAVSSYNQSAYQRLAVEFNKRNPSCHIKLKTGYDETALLTELGAGKGPVLVDTLLTGFDEQEKLWEPLDAVVEQLGIAEELQPAALELGKINGTLYGIVPNLRLRTLVTGSPELRDWNYETFLQCIEDRPQLDAIFNYYSGGGYDSYFIMSFLSHGMDDTYLLDAEAGTTNFDSSGFRSALELAEKYCARKDGVSPGSSLVEGKVLCNELTVQKPEDLALYRLCYGEDANYIGYPTKDGSAHFVESGDRPLAIRRTATKEEKEAAAAFISLCLSYEGQSLMAKDLDFALSVRRDVLEEQIAAMDKDTMVFVSGFDEIVLGDDVNRELDGKTLLDMLDKARPWRYFPAELRKIMYDELDQYFSGAIAQDKLIDNLESRVGLYLGERGN